jgi:hypothetical protein
VQVILYHYDRNHLVWKKGTSQGKLGGTRKESQASVAQIPYYVLKLITVE